MSADRGLASLLLDLVRKAIAPLDYYATYRGSVVRQATDGTLDIKPDDKRLPGFTGVPIRCSIPGVSVRVAQETRVLVSFENGDRRYPVVTGFEHDTLLELVVTATTRVTVVSPAILLGSGGAAQPVPLGNALRSWLEAHTHPTAMGPSGTPVQASTLSNTLSTHHRLDT